MRPPRMIIAAAAGALVAIPGFAIAAPGGVDLLSSEPAAEEVVVATEHEDPCNDVPDDGTPDCTAAEDATTCDDSGVTDNGEPDCVPPAPTCDDDPDTTEIPDCEPEEVDCEDDANADLTECQEDEAEEVDCEDEANADLTECQEDEGDTQEDDETAAEEDGHGAAISALAQCMPGGRQLHGVGFNKGFVISQAASTGEVMLPDAQEGMPVTSPEEATAVCDAVDALVELADEEAETSETDDERAQGRPDWAGPKSDDTDEVEDTEDTTGTAEVEDEERGGPPAHAGGRGKGKGGR